jgi:hypothetical protein
MILPFSQGDFHFPWSFPIVVGGFLSFSHELKDLPWLQCEAPKMAKLV